MRQVVQHAQQRRQQRQRLCLLSILKRVYTFKDFAQALAFTNKVWAVAEAEGHYPDLYVAWGKCKLEIWFHKIKGLTENDFDLAVQAERQFKPFCASTI